MPKDLDPYDPKWKKENRDPKDRGTTPAHEHERHQKREEEAVDTPPPEND